MTNGWRQRCRGRGPVFSQFAISHPFDSGSFATRVRLYCGTQRVDVETRIMNDDKSVRCRMLVPTLISSGKHFDEIPFGSVERAAAPEFPAQNSIDRFTENPRVVCRRGQEL